MQFFHVSITFAAQELVVPAQFEKSGFLKNEKMTIFSWFLWKRTRIDLQGPMVLERHQDVKTSHLVWIYGGKSKIWTLLTRFWLRNAQVKFLKSWKIVTFFYRDKHTLLAKGAPDGQIHFFSIRAGESSFWAVKVVRASKNWIFSQFSDFFNLLDFDNFWPGFAVDKNWLVSRPIT